jgi:hypothetical protein
MEEVQHAVRTIRPTPPQQRRDHKMEYQDSIDLFFRLQRHIVQRVCPIWFDYLKEMLCPNFGTSEEGGSSYVTQIVPRQVVPAP